MDHLERDDLNELSIPRVSRHRLLTEVDDERANVGQATKGTRGIPWHQQPKKDAVDRERPGEAVNRR